MSYQAVKWAMNVQTGNVSRKAVLLILAEHANSDGADSFPGQETIARQTEQSVDTVQRHIKAMMADGLLTRKRCFDHQGHRKPDTYTLNLDRKACGLGLDRKACGLGGKPKAAPDPNPKPQSCGLHIDEPPLNHQRKKEAAKVPPLPPNVVELKRKTKLPDDWIASEADRAYARAQGLDDGQIGFQEKSFKEHWQNPDTKDAEKSDWPATWRKWILRSIGYAKSVANLPRDHAPASASKPPSVFVQTYMREEWEAWRQYHVATGQKPAEATQYRYGFGAYFPSRWPPDYQPQLAKQIA